MRKGSEGVRVNLALGDLVGQRQNAVKLSNVWKMEWAWRCFVFLSGPVLYIRQVLEGLAAGSAFDVIARTESTLLDLSSGVFGAPATLVLEAVPPVLARVQLRPPDAATTELILEYEVRDTAGRMYYVLTEAEAAAKGGKVRSGLTCRSYPNASPILPMSWSRDPDVDAIK